MVGRNEIVCATRTTLEIFSVEVANGCDVVVFLSATCGIVFPRSLLCCVACESVVFDINVRLVAIAYAIVGVGT